MSKRSIVTSLNSENYSRVSSASSAPKRWRDDTEHEWDGGVTRGNGTSLALSTRSADSVVQPASFPIVPRGAESEYTHSTMLKALEFSA